MAAAHRTARRVITWAAAAAAAGLVLFAVFGPRPVPVDVAAIARGGLQVTLDREGKTRVRERYVVSAPVAGRALRIELQPGDSVVAGKTVVATFLPAISPMLDARTRAEAEARVRAAAAAVSQARASLAEAEAHRDLAGKQRDRAEELRRQDLAPQSDLDAAEAGARASTDAARAAAAAVSAAQHELDAARAAVMSAGSPGTAPPHVLTIRAPADGVVLERLHESEAVVAAGEPLVVIANPSDLEIVADYLSTEAVQIRADMPALIDRWGGSHLLHGHVRRVEPFGFIKVSALGVEEQRVNVIVGLDDPRSVWQSLGDGYRVEVRVVLWDQHNVLQVPTSSLFRRGNDWAVFALQGGRARLRTVTIGERTGLEAQVLGGLNEGDRVIVHPSDAVADGVRVKPR